MTTRKTKDCAMCGVRIPAVQGSRYCDGCAYIRKRATDRRTARFIGTKWIKPEPMCDGRYRHGHCFQCKGHGQLRMTYYARHNGMRWLCRTCATDLINLQLFGEMPPEEFTFWLVTSIVRDAA